MNKAQFANAKYGLFLGKSEFPVFRERLVFKHSQIRNIILKFHHKTILTLALAACFSSATVSAKQQVIRFSSLDTDGHMSQSIYMSDGRYYHGSGYIVAHNINGLNNLVSNNRYDYAFAGLGNDTESQSVFSEFFEHTQLEKDSMADKVASRDSDFARVAIFDTGVDLTSNMINNANVDRIMYKKNTEKNVYEAVKTEPVESYGSRKMHGTKVLSTVQELAPNVRAGVYVLNSIPDVGQIAYIERKRHYDNKPVIINMSAGIETRYNGSLEELREIRDTNNVREIGKNILKNNALVVISSGNDSVTRYRQETYSNGVQTVRDNVLDITDDTYVNVSANALTPLFHPEYRNHFVVTTGVDQYGNHIFNSCRYHQDYCVAAPADLIIKNNHLQGTSFAAPYVTGTLASIQNRYDWMTVKDLQQTLFTTATPMADRNTYGHGIVNYFKAVQGYGRFDDKTELNVNGQKNRYYFDNDISGNGYLVKKGDKSLVLNGNNTYNGGEHTGVGSNAPAPVMVDPQTGNYFYTGNAWKTVPVGNIVQEGELVLNGMNVANALIQPNATLTVGDKDKITSGTVINKGTLNAETTSDLVINGELWSENATINKAIGSKIQVSNNAYLYDANFVVRKIADGYVTQAGKNEVLLTAQKINSGGKTLNYIVDLPDLLTADMQQSDTQISANMKRKSAVEVYSGEGYSGEGYRSTKKQTQFEGGLQDAQLAERYLKDMDSIAYANGDNQISPNAVAMDFIATNQLDRTLFANGTMTTHHAAEEINLNKQSHDLDFVGNLKHGSNMWVNVGTDRNRLNLTGLTGKSEDYSTQVGVAKKLDNGGTVGGAINKPHYRWKEDFNGINKTVKTDGVGVNVGYAHEFNDYRIFGALSYEHLQVDQGASKNNDGDQFGVVVGAGKEINADRWTITPSLALAYEQSKIDSVQINDKVRADDIESRHLSAVAELEAGYQLVDNLRLTSKIGVAQDLHSKTRHTAVYDGTHAYDYTERETPKTRGTSKIGLAFSPTPNFDIGANIGYAVGKHWQKGSADIGLRYKF